MNDFPSLAGADRWRFEKWSAACWLFDRQTVDARKAICAFAVSGDKRIESAADEMLAARSDNLSKWKPPHSAN